MMIENPIFKTLDARTRIIFTGALIGLLFSKGFTLMPGLALDDYAALQSERSPLFYISQGRYTQAGIELLLAQIGVSPTAIAWSMALMFFLAAGLTIAVGIEYTTRKRGSVWVLACVAALIGSYPYLTEYFTFRQSLPTQGFSFVLSAIIIAMLLMGENNTLSLKSIKVRFSFIFMLLLLAGAQQTAYLVVIFFVIGRIACDALNENKVIQVQNAIGKNREILYLIAASSAIYIAIFLFIKKIINLSIDSRSAFLSSNGLWNRVHEVKSLFVKVLFINEPILSSDIKYLLVGVVFVCLISVSVSDFKKGITCFFLFIVLSMSSILLVSISAVWWPVPRAIYGIGFAFGIALSVMSVWLTRYRAVIISLICLATLGCMLHSNAMLYDQWRLNRWDMWTAGALAENLTDLNVSPSKHVIFVGADWGYPVGPKTIEGDLNVSVFTKEWDIKYLMSEATGRYWNVDVSRSLPGFCNNESIWPSPQSIHIQKNDVIVCMGKTID